MFRPLLVVNAYASAIMRNVYADDFCLIAMGRHAVRHMRRLLAIVDHFNAASGMRAAVFAANTGLGKTDMMLSGVSGARCALLQEEVFKVGGEAIRFVLQYKYLGICIMTPCIGVLMSVCGMLRLSRHLV